MQSNSTTSRYLRSTIAIVCSLLVHTVVVVAIGLWIVKQQNQRSSIPAGEVVVELQMGLVGGESAPEPTPEPEPEPTPTPEISEYAQGESADVPVEQGELVDRVVAGGSDKEALDGDVAQAEVTYQQQLLQWLQKHKRYPRRLQRRGVEGEVLLSMTIGRSGALLEYRIEQSSGEPLLDKAAVQLLQDAEPMPALPETMKTGEYAVSVPIRYFLR